MTDLERSLADADAELREIGARFALVGGLAVAVRGEPRLTRDADFAIAVDSDAEAEDIVRSLTRRGYRIIASVEQQSLGRLATVRLTRAATDRSVVTDLLFASCGIEPEIVAAADDIAVLEDLTLPVATVGHLIAMKLLARDDRQRPTDADDLDGLRSRATPADWASVEHAVTLIAERGFARGRDLRGALVTLRELGAFA